MHKSGLKCGLLVIENIKRKTEKTAVTSHFLGLLSLVEMTGVEPVSKKSSARVSPGAAYLRDSPA